MTLTKEKLIAWLIFFLIGMHLVIVAKTPLEIKIIHDDTGSTAQIHRASCIEPFKTVDINIPDLKCAIIENSLIHFSHNKKLQKLKLESLDGKKTSISPLFYSIDIYPLDFKELQNKINDSITNKTDFQYRCEQTICFMYGVMLIAISFSVFIPKEYRLTKKSKRRIDGALFYVAVIACAIFFFACIYFYNPL